MQEDMFTSEETKSKQSHSDKTCKTCKFRERWKCNSKVFQYCGKRTSGRTFNGLLKIRAKDNACNLYEEAVYFGNLNKLKKKEK